MFAYLAATIKREMSWVYDYYWGRDGKQGVDERNTHIGENHQPCIDVKDLENDDDGD